jgi:hypothetical protein
MLTAALHCHHALPSDLLLLLGYLHLLLLLLLVLELQVLSQTPCFYEGYYFV